MISKAHLIWLAFISQNNSDSLLKHLEIYDIEALGTNLQIYFLMIRYSTNYPLLKHPRS